MSRCAGAGREHSQTASQAGQWKYSIPWTSCSSLLIEVCWGAGICSSLFHEFKSSLVQEFKYFQEFSLFQEFCEISQNP